MDNIAIKWKSIDLSNNKVLNIVFRDLHEYSNKYVYFHIQRRLIYKTDFFKICGDTGYKVLRKYKDYYYIQEIEGHTENTWYAISSAIDKLKRKLNES